MKKNAVDMRFVEHAFPNNSDSLVVALIQIEGPLPHGKHISVIDGRETYVWRDLADMRTRVNKAVEIVRGLYKRHPEIKVFIFPEYSLPVSLGLPILQALSRETGTVIIPGADSFNQPDGQIYTQSLVILPDRQDPITVTKWQLSKWEQGLIDVPTAVTNPIFVWRVGSNTYSLTIFLCIDLLYAQRALEEVPNAQPGIIIGPMCSPDIDTFRVYADSLLRSEEGVGVILANCVGDAACGSSAVHVVSPSGKGFKPTIELPTSGEAAAVCEIRCNHLAPPRKSVPGLEEALGKRYLYTVRFVGDTLSLTSADNVSPDRMRAVLNPALFDITGKRLRLAFLGVDEFASLGADIHAAGFEILAILGQHDIAVTHLHENDYGLIVDVNQRIPVRRPGAGANPRTGPQENFPYFEVESFHKVLGVAVSVEHRNVFNRGGPFPSEDEMVRIMDLGNDWSTSSVTAEERTSFLNHRWILASTTMQPGQIDAIMTICLIYAGAGVTEPLVRFEDRVLPVLISKPQITSIYGGTGHFISMHFVLRITSSKEQLFDLIDEIHKLASAEKILITTTTYVVMKKLAGLDLAAAFSSQGLPPAAEHYWGHVILPMLSQEERGRARVIPATRRSGFIDVCRQLQRCIQDVANKPWASRREDCFRRAVVGLLFDELLEVKELHNIFQSAVERILTDTIAKLISEKEFDSLRSSLNVPPGKMLKTMTYTERIKLLSHLCKAGRLEDSWSDALAALMTHTTQVRNAFTHDKREELDEGKIIAAIRTYASFLSERSLP